MDIHQRIQALQQHLGEQEQLLLTLQVKQDREQGQHQALCQEQEALLEALLQRQSSTALLATRNTVVLVQARAAVVRCELVITSSRVKALAARVRAVVQASCATQLALDQLRPD